MHNYKDFFHMITNEESKEKYKDVKDQNQLVKEILDLNIDIDKNTFEFCISKFNVIHDMKKNYIFNNIHHIKDEFTTNLKDKFHIAFNNDKLILLMIYANYILYGYYPRDIQIISLLLFIYKPKKIGLIEQINTGEGKSLIISFLAAYLNIVENKKIDILTSSIILAERDYNLYKDFYEIFDIKSDYCRQNTDNKNQYKICYSADIVYGDCLNFEADILRSNFLGAPGRKADRNFDCIIIDEIDNICIDNIKNLTELLDDFPGYKLMEYIYIYIYNLLIKIDEEYEKNEIVIIINKEKIIAKLIDEFETFVNGLKKNNFDMIYYPIFLHDYILLRKKEWCRNAFEAKYIFKKNKQYIISKNELGDKVIKPIDYHNTGVIQQNSIWPGLHQFLELKEGLNLTAENLNSCYMSNLTFFKKYKNVKENNIYGLTGTLGSKETQLALKNIYNMKFILIPTFRPNLLKNPTYFIADDRQVYLDAIVNNIKYYSKERAVLVIFEYIESIKEIKKLLFRDNEININDIIIYKDSENEKEGEFLKSPIDKGKIILATNLAARGTDIKISPQVEKNGGLHVILTFFPTSERIERQALGRAGRKGENGSGELIINTNQKDVDSLLNQRNIREKELYEQLINDFCIRDELYENLFDDFCNLLSKIRNIQSSTKDNYILDLKEKWGFFLIKNNINNVNGKNNKLKEIIEFNYKKFEKEINSITQLKNYKFRNPLIESNNISLIGLQRIVDECEIYSIGANYFIIYLLIQTNETLEKIEQYKKILEGRLKEIIKFYADYIKGNIQKILIYENAQNNDLVSQIDERIELFNLMLVKVKELNEILNYKETNPNIKLKIGKKTLIKDLRKINNRQYTKESIQFMSDLGIYFLFECEVDRSSCCPI